MSTVFIEANDLQPQAKWIDVRFDLANPQAGEALYNEGHIENAVYWHLERDLSDMTSSYGRHPMPSQKQLESLIQATGLTYDDDIYIYDQGAAPFAARAWAILQYAGFTKMRIVNGGLNALLDSGYTLTTASPNVQPSTITINWQPRFIVDVNDVERIVAGEEQATLLDARANIRYRGEMEPIDAVAGHIPTAKNYDWEQLKQDGKLTIPETLTAKVDKEEQIVVYCGSGVTASPLYAVLNEAGYKNVRLYMGSFSDWIRKHDVEKQQNS